MSHFTVVVAVKNPDDLEKVMAPYDEDLEVEPYREYETDPIGEYWVYRMLVRAAKDQQGCLGGDHSDCPGVKPYDPNGPGWSSESSRQTCEQQAAEIAKHAKIFHAMSQPISWQEIVKISRELWPDDDDHPEYDAEVDNIYTTTTRNPEGKWDYWRVGGRWGGYFRYKEGCEDQVKDFTPEGNGYDSPKEFDPRSCNGGPKGALDLDALRQAKVTEFLDRVREFEAIVAGTPEALPWKHFYDRMQAEESYAAQQAREDYNTQPRVMRIHGVESDFRYASDAIGRFQLDARELKIATEKARAAAVPGYATVTLEGKWMAPGEMGWFGTSTESESEQIGYWEVANAYIESLPDEVYLIALDCHV